MSSTSDDESVELQRERYESILQSPSEVLHRGMVSMKGRRVVLRGEITAETTAPPCAAAR